MRISDKNGAQLDHVNIALTDAEAKELHDALAQLMVEKPPTHFHVMDERSWTANDAERVEKEITIYRFDDQDAEKREAQLRGL